MSNEQKTAIKSAVERLDQETTERLTNEIHDYLREELNSVESLKQNKEQIETKIRIHEENIKNVKSGNLEAIEKRRQALHQSPIWTYTVSNSGTNLGAFTLTGSRFYNAYVAGFTYQSPFTGKTYIF